MQVDLVEVEVETEATRTPTTSTSPATPSTSLSTKPSNAARANKFFVPYIDDQGNERYITKTKPFK